MNNFLPEFLIGFICASGLFILSTLLVLGGKTFLLYFRSTFYKKVTPKKPRAKRTPTTVKPAKVKRIVEINPDEVDQIFVKKAS